MVKIAESLTVLTESLTQFHPTKSLIKGDKGIYHKSYRIYIISHRELQRYDF
jgi:hypothetical protein